jgi:hypothetical protein
MDRDDDQGRIPLICDVYYEFENWSNVYTIADFAQSIQDVLNDHPELPLKYWARDSIVEGFGVQGAARHEDTIERVLLLQKDLLDLSKLVENHIEEKQRREFEDYVGEAPPPTQFPCSSVFRLPSKVLVNKTVLRMTRCSFKLDSPFSVRRAVPLT